MRIQKYRFWEPYTKRMLGPYTLYEIKSAHEVAAQCFDHAMQYIGLEDHSDSQVEVYKGDIVKVWHEDEPEEFQIGKVWWFDCYYPAFDIYIPNKKTGTGFESYSDEFNSFSCPDYRFEVIGNIYEHKDLIDTGER